MESSIDLIKEEKDVTYAYQVDNKGCKEKTDKEKELDNEIMIQIRIRKAPSDKFATKDSWKMKEVYEAPIVMKVPPTTTVSGLREILGLRISRALRLTYPEYSPGYLVYQNEMRSTFSSSRPGMVSYSNCGKILYTGSLLTHLLSQTNEQLSKYTRVHWDEMDHYNGKEEWKQRAEAAPSEVRLSIMNQVALTFHNNKSPRQEENVGSMSLDQLIDSPKYPPPFANPNDKEEKELVTANIGNEGVLFMNWPIHLNGVLNEEELSFKEEVTFTNGKIVEVSSGVV